MLKTLTREVKRQVDAEFTEIVAAAEFNWNDRDDRAWLAANITHSQRTSQLPWKNYGRIGEVRKAVSRGARIAGYARLRCVNILPDGSDGETVMEGLPAQIVQGIYAPYGGTRGLVERFFALMKVPADAYLIRYRQEDELDGYHFLSSSEIKRSSMEDAGLEVQDAQDIEWITLPHSTSGAGDVLTRPVQGRDMLGRVWMPGRQWLDVPESPLHALETECEVLYGLTESMKANINSRFVLGGLMCFPSEINSVKVPGFAKGSMDVLDYIEKAMSRALKDTDGPEARLPILVKAKGDSIAQIRLITFDREIFESDLNLRKELIDRILFGLDIQVQATRGGEDVSHFGMWAISDEEIRIAIQPDLDTMCWALTRLILHRQLKEAGWSDEKIVGLRIAWDMSESTAKTNMQEDTRQAWDRGLASGNSVLRKGGLSVADDRMSDQERIRLIGMKANNVFLACFNGDSYDDIDWDMVARFAKAKPGPESETAEEEEPSAGPGVGEPGAPSETERRRTRRRTETPSG